MKIYSRPSFDFGNTKKDVWKHKNSGEHTQNTNLEQWMFTAM